MVVPSRFPAPSSDHLENRSELPGSSSAVIPHLGKNPNEANAEVWVTEWGEKEEQTGAEEPQL